MGRCRLYFVVKEYTGWGPFDYLAIGPNSNKESGELERKLK